MKNKYKENYSFERMQGSARNHTFFESVKLKIIDLEIDDLYKSITGIKHEPQNNLSNAPSIGSIYSILKDNSFSYVAPQLARKTYDYIRNKSRDW